MTAFSPGDSQESSARASSRFHEMKAVLRVPPSFITLGLFFAVLFGVSHHSLFGVLSGVN